MPINLKQAKYYFNRELSWLKFNERVLEEAEDQNHPLIERMKFLSIFSSNLDEFFMIRVAGLKEQIHAGISEVPIDGLSPQEQITRISGHTHKLVERQSRILLEDVYPKLRNKGIRIRFYNTLTPTQKTYLDDYFQKNIYPVLTPLAIDPAHPFPQLRNLGLNLFVELKTPFQRGETKKAVVPVPQLMDRFIQIPGKNDYDFILIEDLIIQHLDSLFPQMKILRASEFRITRNADLDLSEAEADDLLQLIERELRKRRLGTVIRLEVSTKMNTESKKFLKNASGLKEEDIYEISGPLDMSPFMFLLSLDLPNLKDPEFTPALKEEIISYENIFRAIRKKDILLFHPYESFNHVIELIQEAAKDPKVLAIKQTLYRTSGKSPIVQGLKDAVAKGKQVTALIELKARFDEETNIVWAKELEQTGVNVIYGLLGLKTHCKLCMIVRQEEGLIRRYLHMSTGNYNAKTASIYTDFGFMTCDEEMGEDASELFNLLTGFSRQKDWRKFLVAPASLRPGLTKLIRDCISKHKEGQTSRIRMVMNSLVDPEMIQMLYKASQAGIQVDLVIRGICCLRPGIKGISENIRIRSIVGRFLEHTRVFIFDYNETQKIYLGSADLMQRNLNRRVELVFPIEEESLRNEIVEIVEILLKDNEKSRTLDAEGNYTRVQPGLNDKILNAQEHFLQRSRERRLQTDTINP